MKWDLIYRLSNTRNLKYKEKGKKIEKIYEIRKK